MRDYNGSWWLHDKRINCIVISMMCMLWLTQILDTTIGEVILFLVVKCVRVNRYAGSNLYLSRSIRLCVIAVMCACMHFVTSLVHIFVNFIFTFSIWQHNTSYKLIALNTRLVDVSWRCSDNRNFRGNNNWRLLRRNLQSSPNLKLHQYLSIKK